MAPRWAGSCPQPRLGGLAPDEPDVVRLRPVDGSDTEAVGIYLPLEPAALEPSEYQKPDSNLAGDFTGSLLLRDAVRLGLRSGAGPFRSMGRLSVIPRPYQFVPLIMALRLDPVRLLIALEIATSDPLPEVRYAVAPSNGVAVIDQ